MQFPQTSQVNYLIKQQWMVLNYADWIAYQYFEKCYSELAPFLSKVFSNLFCRLYKEDTKHVQVKLVPKAFLQTTDPFLLLSIYFPSWAKFCNQLWVNTYSRNWIFTKSSITRNEGFVITNSLQMSSHLLRINEIPKFLDFHGEYQITTLDIL